MGSSFYLQVTGCFRRESFLRLKFVFSPASSYICMKGRFLASLLMDWLDKSFFRSHLVLASFIVSMKPIVPSSTLSAGRVVTMARRLEASASSPSLPRKEGNVLQRYLPTAFLKLPRFQQQPTSSATTEHRSASCDAFSVTFSALADNRRAPKSSPGPELSCYRRRPRV